MNKWIGLMGLVVAAQATAQVNTLYGQDAGASEQGNAAYNDAYGYEALHSNVSGNGNTAIGAFSMQWSTGNYNTGLGIYSLYNNSTGLGNIGIGAYALQNNLGGNYNIGIGWNAGENANTGGSNNIEIGNVGLAKDNHVIRIGTQGVQTFAAIAGIYGKVVKQGQAVVVNSKGQLGVASTALVSSQPATQDDIKTLRSDLVATKNMVYQLQRQLATVTAQLKAASR